MSWENRWKEQEHELKSNHDLAYRELKSAKDRLVVDKQVRQVF